MSTFIQIKYVKLLTSSFLFTAVLHLPIQSRSHQFEADNQLYIPYTEGHKLFIESYVSHSSLLFPIWLLISKALLPIRRLSIAPLITHDYRSAPVVRVVVAALAMSRPPIYIVLLWLLLPLHLICLLLRCWLQICQFQLCCVVHHVVLIIAYAHFSMHSVDSTVSVNQQIFNTSRTHIMQ